MSRLRPALSLSSSLARPALAASPRIPVRILVPSRGAAESSKTKPKSKSLRNYWSRDRLRTTDAYPLTKELLSSNGPRGEAKDELQVRSPWMAKSKNVTGKQGQPSFLRAQIVSPSLCDDVLEYYSASLERHRGCDILDINPGAGLWSQKLHDFLQPRSHVLLEPHVDKFGKFLNPLVDTPGSRYKLVEKDTLSIDTYRQIVDDNVFPDQVRVDPNSTTEQKVNDTLLVTGSLNWEPRMPGLNFDSMAKQLLHHFAAASWTNDLFHAYGRVRTLIWVQNDDARPMISEAIASFQKANCFLEMTHKLEFVVLAPHRERQTGRGAVGREPQYEVESTVRALQRGREAGIEMPKHRRELIHDVAHEIEEASGGSGRSTSSSMIQHLIRKMENGSDTSGLLTESLISNWRSGNEMIAKYPDVPFKQIFATPNARFFQCADNRDHPARHEHHAYSIKRASNRRNLKIKEDVEEIANIGEEMYNAECKVLSLPDGPEKTALLTHISALEEAWNAKTSKLNKNYSSAPYAELDDRLALRSPPGPRLQWDQRAFEPIVAQPAEVWPQNRVALISMEPLPRAEGTSADWYEWLHDFVYGLYSSPSDPVAVALDKMQHGAHDIMSRCPSLRDPAKGGRLRMEHLRVRMLTQEMVIELLEAYKRWPFKMPGSDHNKYFRYRQGNLHGMHLREVF
jgi:transcription factor 1